MPRRLNLSAHHDIRSREQRAREYFEASYGLATVLNPIIGYAAAAAIVKRSVKNGTPIMDELPQEAEELERDASAGTLTSR